MLAKTHTHTVRTNETIRCANVPRILSLDKTGTQKTAKRAGGPPLEVAMPAQVLSVRIFKHQGFPTQRPLSRTRGIGYNLHSTQTSWTMAGTATPDPQPTSAWHLTTAWHSLRRRRNHQPMSLREIRFPYD